MTSASELFHSRRHRLGRSALDLGLDTELNAADSLRRHYHLRRLRHHPERASDRIDGSYRRSFASESVDSEENVRSSLRGSDSERLPVGVVLARARLLQRLRGEPLSTNRQYDRDSFGEDRESELSNEDPTRASLVSDLTSQMARSQFLQELNTKPPGLTQEALDCLHQEVFSSSGNEIGLESRVLQDCSICLESFTDGDELIRLPCGHKFHSVCLDPWIRCCGDCPYCRRSIVVIN
ncbi:probable E3 ubiquitin-protein ligase RHY1A [Glycine soja]|uniref:Putative E3 ubiquitin-protein ligase RHY1A n=1 Tax=Glycine soja TaxID=3848 RepID=A0A445F4G7_GLYSO|nr:probable E3 ubiquitin-protein ligase RHY1A [Glycine soja]RZB43713.1 putative E3 ubiquitin-protein ligase RHY1A [Glycine soja]